MDAEAERLHLHPGRRGPRRGERVRHRAARRRVDPQLPGVGGPLPRRGVNATDFEPLAEVLARHGLAEAPEEPFPNDGWSGASMTLLRRGQDRFVLKRDSLARDWIARATRDGPVLREAWFAAHGPPLPAPIRAPYLGVGVDGDTFGILMPDLTGILFDWDAPISVETLERVLDGLAELHSYPWTGTSRLRNPPFVPDPRTDHADLSGIARAAGRGAGRRRRPHPARLGCVRPPRPSSGPGGHQRPRRRAGAARRRPGSPSVDAASR